MAEQVAKRIRVDVSGEEVAGNKRQKVDQITTTSKTASLLYACSLTLKVKDSLKSQGNVIDPESANVLEAQKYFTVAYRCHQYMRQKAQETTSQRVKKIEESGNQSITICGVEHQYTAEDMKAWQMAAVVEAKKVKADFSPFGDAHSIMCLLQLFTERLKECQIGPDSFIYKKTRGEDGKTIYYKMDTFGIPSQYRHLLSGLSWDENMRSTLAKNTTGLCQAVLLAVGKNDKYATKHKVAFERAFDYLPNVKAIAEHLANNPPAMSKWLLKKLADLTALHGDKHKRRVSPCIASIITAAVRVNKGAGTSGSGGYIYDLGVLANIGFSSKKGAILYNAMENLICPAGTRGLGAQIIFHATFGTHGEDFGILAGSTSLATWQTREQFTKFFKSLKVKAPEISKFDNETPIKIRYYSKSISANQTDILVKGGEVQGCLAMFSGSRKKFFSDALLQIVNDKVASQPYAVDATTIAANLDELIAVLTSEIGKMRKEGIVYGTTQWYDITGASFDEGVDGRLMKNMILEEVGKCYWSNK